MTALFISSPKSISRSPPNPLVSYAMEKLNLHEDILVEVLCRLPKISLARFKCVSKRWCSLISDRSRVFPKTTTTNAGLACQSFLPLRFRLKASTNDLEKHHSRMHFLRVDNKGGASLSPSHLSNNIVDEANCLLVSSCHGFLLFRRERLKQRRLGFVVFHPSTKRSWNLSQPRYPNGMHIGLVSDGHCFKLVLFSVSEQGSSGTWFTSDVYSSENEEWSVEKWHSPSVNIPRRGNRTMDPAKSVFLNGAFHWIWTKYLLIYHLGKADCELVQFPRFPKIGGYMKRQDQCIWDSEGFVNYCQVSSTGDRIRIWTLHKRDWNHKQNEYSFKWKEKHEGILAPPPVAEIKHHISFAPVAFNDDFEIVYLMSGRSIFSYNLATKEMKEACTSPFEGSDDRALCICLPILYLSQFNIAAAKTRVRELCSPCSDGILKRRKLQVSSAMEDVIFPEDIVLEILCRLPKKSLARFKCVSKHWLSLISDRNHVFPKTSHAGLVCQSFLPLRFRLNASTSDLEQPHSRMHFFRVDNEGSASLTPPHLTNNIIDEENCLLISSCHGFLLYSRERLKKRRLGFVVFHPATKRSWNLSQPRYPDGMHIGLVSDGHCFKLVLFSVSELGSSGKWFTSDVYSSETEEWSVEKWHSPSVTIPRRGNRTMDSAKSVFLNDAFHWIWTKYLLIYHLGKAYFELVQFPPFPKIGGYMKRQDQCIWDSEGFVNYCQVSATGDRIRIWTLHKGYWNHKQNEFSFQWKEKHVGILPPPPVAEIKHHKSFSPVAFNDDFEIVYLMFGRSIFSYNLATQEVKEACTSPFEGSDNRALCISLPIPDLTLFNTPAARTRVRELGSPFSDRMLKRRKLL